jgi:hypothetical protein
MRLETGAVSSEFFREQGSYADFSGGYFLGVHHAEIPPVCCVRMHCATLWGLLTVGKFRVSVSAVAVLCVWADMLTSDADVRGS